MKNSTFWKNLAVCSFFSFLSTFGFAQISTPNGLVNTSINNNIGIGTNNSTSRLQIESNGTTGLLNLNFTESQGQAGDGATGGGGSSTVSPSYAFKLNYFPLNLASSTRFTINGNGQTFVGDFAGITNATAKFNVRNDLTIAKSNSKYLDLSFNGNSPALSWTSDLNESFTFSTPSNSHIMTLTYDGKIAFGTNQFAGDESFRVVGISRFESDLNANNVYASFFGVGTSTRKGLLHLKKLDVANSGNLGQSHGIIIENNGWRGHDYSFEVKTGHGRVFTVANSGHIFIGSGLNLESPNSEDFRLYVEKGIRTEGVTVDIASENQWADFVFCEEYDLMPVYELESFIKMNNHLPNVPSAKDVVANGMDLAEINKILLQNIEELTLRLIKMQKEIDALKADK